MNPSGQYLRFAIVLAAAVFATAVLPPVAQAQTFTLLHSFQAASSDGQTPYGDLALDAANNLYGTTIYGGRGQNYGIVFKIDTSGVETIEYLFGLHGREHDGIRPSGGIVQFKGTIYGTTTQGDGTGCDSLGCGTIFELHSGKETVIHSFAAGEGVVPNSGLVRDKSGNLYGTTVQGNSGTVPPGCPSYGCGTVFGVIQGQESSLYTFTGMPDGAVPSGSLLVDASGNIYGTTEIGGTFNMGTVYELSPDGNGGWTERVLYSFTGRSDGGVPNGGLVADSNGSFYGPTAIGGLDTSFGGTQCPTGCGVVFKLRKNTDDSWSEQPLYKFAGPPADGQGPFGTLVRDRRGNLYGVTELGGAAGRGTVFEIAQTDHSEKLLHSFMGGVADGELPHSGLVMDRWGILYGTTTNGGAGIYCSCGTVFRIVP